MPLCPESNKKNGDDAGAVVSAFWGVEGILFLFHIYYHSAYGV